jgi:hypothetical protein
MSDEGRRVLRPGHRIALGPDAYTVIQISGTVVTLQDERGELSAMVLGYLLTAPGFQALDAVPPQRVPQDGRLSTLEADEQERVRWLEGHLIELDTGRHPERPPRAEYDPVLHGTEPLAPGQHVTLTFSGIAMMGETARRSGVCRASENSLSR